MTAPGKGFAYYFRNFSSDLWKSHWLGEEMHGVWSGGCQAKRQIKENLGERLWKLNREDAMDHHNRWRKQTRDDWWPRQVWVGECFFWYRLTQVVLDKIQRAVKRLCVFVRACVRVTGHSGHGHGGQKFRTPGYLWPAMLLNICDEGAGCTNACSVRCRVCMCLKRKQS